MKRWAGFRLVSWIVLIVLLQGCTAAATAPTPTATAEASPMPTPVPRLPIRGLAYSPYRDCQSADSADQPTVDQVRQDLQIVAGMANAIRTYSSTGINAEIPALARSLGLRVSAGAWLGPDEEKNQAQIQGLIALAQKVDLDSVIVGNEVLLRGDLSEDQLLDYIARVKAAVHVPVTTAEIGDVLLAHPRVMAAVDFEMVHLYPFWSGAPVDGAAQAVIDQYHAIQARSGGKPVVIGETGWPSDGPVNGAAVPGLANQVQFAREFVTLAAQDDVDYYYFDAFDEMWKSEGGVGPYWGLLDANRQFKSDVRSVASSFDVTPRPAAAGSAAAGTAQPTPAGGAPGDFYVYSNFSDARNHFAPGGWMGDLDAIHLNTCSTAGYPWPKSVIRVDYAPTDSEASGWAGIYWLQPDHNWGTVPNAGFDLSKYNQLVFRAYAAAPGAQIKFFVGGVSMDSSPTPVPLPHPSSIAAPVFAQQADPVDGFVDLTAAWQQYSIDLTGVDRHYVIDGFGWAAEQARTPQGATFYLDDIRFVSASPAPAALPPIHVYSGAALRSGLNMGVDSSGHDYDWVEDQNGRMVMSYPAGQDWGTLFVTVGKPAPPGARASLDLSGYRTLSLEMRSDLEGQTVFVGIKDSRQPDDGSETVVPVSVTGSWQTYTFDLDRFRGADLAKIYIPIEFVFRGRQPAAGAVYFRNVQVLP